VPPVVKVTATVYAAPSVGTAVNENDVDAVASVGVVKSAAEATEKSYHGTTTLGMTVMVQMSEVPVR